jgi:hypothetical protein
MVCYGISVVMNVRPSSGEPRPSDDGAPCGVTTQASHVSQPLL